MSTAAVRAQLLIRFRNRQPPKREKTCRKLAADRARGGCLWRIASPALSSTRQPLAPG